MYGVFSLGATPWKQQVMIIFGVVASSFAMPAILNLLNNAYGFGVSDDDGDDRFVSVAGYCACA